MNENKLMMGRVRKDDLLYPELSYQIVGILFEVYNTLGYGYLEKYYQKAIAALLRKLKINFTEEEIVEVKVGDEIVASGRADFIIEEKIILEIKKGNSFRKTNIDQLHSYLKMKNLELGILANFTSTGLLYKRIVNIQTATIRNSPICNS
ncbi:MAG: GxxExxY protein [Bacteroidetes bacterium]|nr:MAG: GxxExxY protein [Bacteroidota bacterium]